MSNPEHTRPSPDGTPDRPAGPVRPVGSWVVAGFLLVVFALVWVTMSAVFLSRS
ncbi:hypothetical protein [Paraburkholderia oxyphila]|uniref:hypothetical protein n=1 Tax=Paraburkholderia oxyphila TaxID=614212 RepID=UPI000ACE9DBA|nr:hypothetical protein [Paraburkholderia oxyphila]